MITRARIYRGSTTSPFIYSALWPSGPRPVRIPKHLVIVSAQNRIGSVSPENRIHSLLAENRVVDVEPQTRIETVLLRGVQMGIKRYTKDPGESLDYGFNWSTELGTDTISTSSWSVATGLTASSPSNNNGITATFLSGGTAGTTYRARNTIVTAAGRTYRRSMDIYVEDK